MRCVDVGCRHGAGAVDPRLLRPSSPDFPTQLARFSDPDGCFSGPDRAGVSGVQRVLPHTVFRETTVVPGRPGTFTRTTLVTIIYVLRLVSGYLLILNGKWIKSGPKKPLKR